MSRDKKNPPEPMVDEYGYAGPWGDAKPGEVAPGISTDPEQRIRDMEAADKRQIERDIIGNRIAKLSAQLAEAWDRGDDELAEKLIAEQDRLTLLQLSIR